MTTILRSCTSFLRDQQQTRPVIVTGSYPIHHLIPSLDIIGVMLKSSQVLQTTVAQSHPAIGYTD
jgi:hypothetical protein